MNVLITGGYGFIGSHVAEVFYKAGHEVIIIDNLSTGNQANVNCKHKSYKLDIEDKKCDKVFRANKIDLVVHLIEKTSIEHSQKDKSDDINFDIIGLVNMLELSLKYEVKRFIFLSSVAVYGNSTNIPVKEDEKCEPVSPYGIRKLMGEELCQRWRELYKIETLCIRVSNIYGPRQNSMDKCGLITDYIERLTTSEKLIVYGDGSQSGDFIYVKDVAKAICKASESHITGIYNLSTETEISIDELIDILKEFYAVKTVKYKSKGKEKLINLPTESSKLKRDLQWSPETEFKEGIKLTNDWYIEKYTENIHKYSDKRESKSEAIVEKVKPYLETFLLFIVILLLDKFLMKDSVFRIFDLKLLFVVICSVAYGTKQSIISILLASSVLLYDYFSLHKDPALLMLDANFIGRFLTYMLVGIIIGYTVDKKDMEIETTAIEKKSIKEKYEYLEEIYNYTYETKNKLQDQIINSEDGFGKVYGIITKLNLKEIQQVFKAALEVLEDVLKVDTISIYEVDDAEKTMTLVASSKKEHFKPEKIITVDKLEEMKEQLYQGEIIINRDMEANKPIIMSPLMNDKKLVGVIMLHEVDFERLTLFFENLFCVVSRLIALSIEKASMHEKKSVVIPEELENNLIEIENPPGECKDD